MIKLRSKKVREFTEDEKAELELITEFESIVYKVHDGDTITIKILDFNFLTPMRFLGTNAPELNEVGGKEAKEYLENLILRKEVTIVLGDQKEEKWGRLLGQVMFNGMFMDEEMILVGHSTPFDRRKDGVFPEEEKAFEEGSIAKSMDERKWQM